MNNGPVFLRMDSEFSKVVFGRMENEFNKAYS
jgi:hypothetical protein